MLRFFDPTVWVIGKTKACLGMSIAERVDEHSKTWVLVAIPFLEPFWASGDNLHYSTVAQENAFFDQLHYHFLFAFPRHEYPVVGM
jgi:hypothetical protein